MGSDIDQVRDHLRQAARSVGERLMGRDTAHHLRQAARHALLAGVEAIDKAEARVKATSGCCHETKDQTSQPASSDCCGGSKPSSCC